MLADLLTSTRELRNPLTVGYSVLFAAWLLLGDVLDSIATDSGLGQRIATAFHDLGSASELAAITFLAAIIGSVVWNLFVEDLVAWLMRDFPQWDSLIREERFAVEQYETYKVKFPSTRYSDRTNVSTSSEEYVVPSRHGGMYAHQRVEYEERRQSEVVFRVTLTACLVPVSVALGLAGGGLWWLSVVLFPFVWVDVARLKHTTQNEVDRLELAQVEASIPHLDSSVVKLQRIKSGEEEEPATQFRRDPVEKRLEEAIARRDKARRRREELGKRLGRRTSRFFGRPTYRRIETS